MNKPTLADLMNKDMDNKYTLVMIIAKRARRIASGEKALVELETVKPVSVAAHEVAAGKVVGYNEPVFGETESAM